MSSANDQTIPVYAGWIGSWQISLRRRPLGVLDLAKRYDRVAPRWSHLTDRLGYPRTYRRLFEQFFNEADLARTAPPLRVLDCGIGTGALSLALAQAWGAPVRIDAVHVSEVMIEKARQCLHQAGLDGSVESADVCALPYPTGQFNVVMAAHVLEHLPNPVVALKEMQRVLKPGGWLVACLTRESILGRYVQLKWRTHRLTVELGESWLETSGLGPHRLKFTSSGCFRLTSLTCIGRKPHVQA